MQNQHRGANRRRKKLIFTDTLLPNTVMLYRYFKLGKCAVWFEWRTDNTMFFSYEKTPCEALICVGMTRIIISWCNPNKSERSYRWYN